jgi:hypothetical protein
MRGVSLHVVQMQVDSDKRLVGGDLCRCRAFLESEGILSQAIVYIPDQEQ